MNDPVVIFAALIAVAVVGVIYFKRRRGTRSGAAPVSAGPAMQQREALDLARDLTDDGLDVFADMFLALESGDHGTLRTMSRLFRRPESRRAFYDRFFKLQLQSRLDDPEQRRGVLSAVNTYRELEEARKSAARREAIEQLQADAKAAA